jgi:hypothetical protein
MPTPVSATTPYVLPSEIENFSDIRIWLDLLSDTDNRLTSAAVTNNTSSPALPILQAAAGMIEAACFRAASYSPTDLQALTGNSQQLLKSLNTRIGVGEAYLRRPRNTPIPPQYLQALKLLDELEAGSKIFGLQEHADKGNVTERVQTLQDVEKLNLATWQANRLFGWRGNERG